ncbi:MAG: helix-turn-helix domain-containing protein [Burkholderiaceae bacterium]
MTYRYNDPVRQPTPAEIKDARIRAHLTQQAAAELVHRATRGRWAAWEAGTHEIDLAVWELFLIKSKLRESPNK